MEDENDANDKDDNEPSASKKESDRASDKSDERRGEDHGSNSMTHSESFTSASYSARSRLDMADASPKLPKPPIDKREVKQPEKKKRGRRPAGKVEKRKKAPARRVAKRKPRRDRDLSASTIFTRLSSLSGSANCRFCGHRCCRRRYENERRCRRKYYKRKKPRRVRKRKVVPKIRNLIHINRGSKGIQAGSRCMMLSPLFIATNASPPEQLPELKNNYCEITPEMIYQALRRLTMWRQFVVTTSIMDYLKRNYPVNPNEKELLAELNRKLAVATVVGIVQNVADDSWCLQKRTLDTSHVTKFWQIYGDTMKPIRRQKPPLPEKGTDVGCSTNKRGPFGYYTPRYL